MPPKSLLIHDDYSKTASSISPLDERGSIFLVAGLRQDE
jgi:hypothetical protein